LSGDAVKSRTKVVGFVVAAIVGLCGFSVWHTYREVYGVGVDSVGWLPPEAHNITYLRHGLIAWAEFDIEPEAFARWCARAKKPLHPLGDEVPLTMSRCGT
jgi:hypothetical protein